MIYVAAGDYSELGQMSDKKKTLNIGRTLYFKMRKDLCNQPIRSLPFILLYPHQHRTFDPSALLRI